MSQSCPAILSCLRTHGDDVTIARQGLKALQQMRKDLGSGARQSAYERAMQEGGGYRLVLKAMSDHALDTEVQYYGTSLISWFTSDFKGDDDFTEAACDAVVAALRNCGTDADCVDTAGNTIECLYGNSERLRAGGVCEALIAALAATLHDAAAQGSALRAMRCLKGCAVDFGAGGACEALVRAMDAHPADVRVQEEGVLAAVMLLSVVDNRERLLRTGARAAMTRAVSVPMAGFMRRNAGIVVDALDGRGGLEGIKYWDVSYVSLADLGGLAALFGPGAQLLVAPRAP
eukprot:TRINITY_DN15852_c0_g1_i1.p1 TRINITY_DN15852_c0_g1~~TRINITY_DN15852_c0_g1_i1.p1  ORF type:complete len:289 (+),score=92.00 TRINITY_DN15852_c0_g1_i1:78-944(+)